MAPRKRKPVDSESEPEASEDFVPSAEASESSDFEAEESPAPKKKAPAKKRAPPKPKAKGGCLIERSGTCETLHSPTDT